MHRILAGLPFTSVSFLVFRNGGILRNAVFWRLYNKSFLQPYFYWYIILQTNAKQLAITIVSIRSIWTRIFPLEGWAAAGGWVRFESIGPCPFGSPSPDGCWIGYAALIAGWELFKDTPIGPIIRISIQFTYDWRTLYANQTQTRIQFEQLAVFAGILTGHVKYISGQVVSKTASNTPVTPPSFESIKWHCPPPWRTCTKGLICGVVTNAFSVSGDWLLNLDV